VDSGQPGKEEVMQVTTTTRFRPRLLRVRQRNVPLHTLSVEISLSWIKALVLDEQGIPTRPPHKQVFAKTPVPAIPAVVSNTVLVLARQLEHFDRASVGFPGLVCDGVVVESPDLGSAWEGCTLAHMLSGHLGRPVRVASATDIQGFGAVSGKGIEVMLSLGNSVHASLFLDGILIPNVQIGKHKLEGQCLTKDGLQKWSERLEHLITILQKRFGCDRLYLGGPNARQIRSTILPSNITIVSSLNTLLGGMALWRDPEHRLPTDVVFERS
jgi:polyphosphate glucokinase